MSTFDELLAKAKAAPKPYRDIDVSLDQAVAEQAAGIDQQIEDHQQELLNLSTDKRLSDPRPAEIEGQIAKLEEQREALTEGTLITLRFTQMRGEDWAKICARCPARPDSIIDRMYGYNYQQVAKYAAVSSGNRVVDGEIEELSDEQWDGLWEVLSGYEFEKIASDLWAMNDHEPRQRIEAAGKASRAGSGSKSN